MACQWKQKVSLGGALSIHHHTFYMSNLLLQSNYCTMHIYLINSSSGWMFLICRMARYYPHTNEKEENAYLSNNQVPWEGIESSVLYSSNLTIGPASCLQKTDIQVRLGIGVIGLSHEGSWAEFEFPCLVTLSLSPSLSISISFIGFPTTTDSISPWTAVECFPPSDNLRKGRNGLFQLSNLLWLESKTKRAGFSILMHHSNLTIFEQFNENTIHSLHTMLCVVD